MKLERHFSWLTIHNLPLYVVAAQGMLYVWSYIYPDQLQYLVLDRAAVFYGREYWRLLTFLFITPIQNPIFAFFFLYLLYIYGTALEDHWGNFHFTVFYLLGALGTTIAGLFFGNAGGAFFLNTTIFLAFAAVYPNMELLLFFILPVKVKWLAWLTWLWLGYEFALSHIVIKVSILVSLVNYFLFFGAEHWRSIYAMIRRKRFQNRYERDDH